MRLSRKNAETLFNLVADRGLENTEVVLTGVTPGGDTRSLSRRGRKTSIRNIPAIQAITAATDIMTKRRR
ncbi:MAG: hypothetical protein R3D30_14290 [Hyphomicrobiales bacterium]